MKLIVISSLICVLLWSCEQHADEVIISDKDNTLYINAVDYIHSLDLEESNSQNALDWDGEYKGITPCDDCEGVQSKIIIYPDHTYQHFKYNINTWKLEEIEKGSFHWDETGDIIILNNTEKNRYRVYEDFILMLDDSRLNAHYKLIKND